MSGKEEGDTHECDDDRTNQDNETNEEPAVLSAHYPALPNGEPLDTNCRCVTHHGAMECRQKYRLQSHRKCTS